MKEQALAIWRRVTLRRHSSELAVLRVARNMPGLFAILLIMFNLIAWWFVLTLPLLILFTLGWGLAYGGGQPMRTFGYALLVLAQIGALPVVIAAAPWFFRWYFIAAGLMLGRTGMADRKEAELVTSLGEQGRVG